LGKQPLSEQRTSLRMLLQLSCCGTPSQPCSAARAMASTPVGVECLGPSLERLTLGLHSRREQRSRPRLRVPVWPVCSGHRARLASGLDKALLFQHDSARKLPCFSSTMLGPSGGGRPCLGLQQLRRIAFPCHDRVLRLLLLLMRACRACCISSTLICKMAHSTCLQGQ